MKETDNWRQSQRPVTTWHLDYQYRSYRHTVIQEDEAFLEALPVNAPEVSLPRMHSRILLYNIGLATIQRDSSGYSTA